MSEAYLKKLLEIQFSSLKENGWFKTALLWCIDSKYRTYKAVNKFLQEQITNPDIRLVQIAHSLRGNNVYDTVHNVEDYVIRNYVYVTDQDNFGMLEKWATAYEVFTSRHDDCDGQNLLIWVLCVFAGVDHNMIYCVLGNTSSGYQFYCLFFDARRSRMVKLDATFYPEPQKIAWKEEFKIGTKYYKPDYLFNDEEVYQMN